MCLRVGKVARVKGIEGRVRISVSTRFLAIPRNVPLFVAVVAGASVGA